MFILSIYSISATSLSLSMSVAMIVNCSYDVPILINRHSRDEMWLTDTHTHTDRPTKYRNPCCARTPRVGILIKGTTNVQLKGTKCSKSLLNLTLDIWPQNLSLTLGVLVSRLGIQVSCVFLCVYECVCRGLSMYVTALGSFLPFLSLLLYYHLAKKEFSS